MTNANKTLIGILVDRSGSMSTCREDMEGGLNTLLKEQAKEPGEADVTLAQFDTEYELLYNTTPIKRVKKYTLLPRGGTALLDGVGKLVTDIGIDLDALDEDDKPGKVLICIVTDGQENSSREWTRAAVKKLVTQQQDQYQWEFMFLGANMDAVAEGGSIGIRATSSLTFDTANAGDSYAAASNYMTNSRLGNVANFTDDDRKNAIKKPVTSSGSSK